MEDAGKGGEGNVTGELLLLLTLFVDGTNATDVAGVSLQQLPKQLCNTILKYLPVCSRRYCTLVR